MDDARPSTTKSTCGPDISDKSPANRWRWPPESHLPHVWTGDQTRRQVASCIACLTDDCSEGRGEDVGT